MTSRLKLKNRILLGTFITLLFISYKLGIRKTIEQIDHYDHLSTKIEVLKDTPRQLALLTQKEKYYDSVLGIKEFGEGSVQNNLIRVLNQESAKNTLKVIDFNQPHIFESDNGILYTYSFNLNGGYTAILKTVYTLEQKGNFGEVVHLDFQKKKNYKINKSYLEAKVFMQQMR